MEKKIVGVLAALATAGFPLALSAIPQAAFAQTQGMDRRDDRRDTRQVSRDVKQACKAGDEKTRSECRNTKRDVKQEGRQTPGGPDNQASTTTPR
jgi:Ni/Co efflux regulator RcnB